MGYADIIRTPQPKIEDIASLIEGIFGASSPIEVIDFTPTFTCNGSMTVSATTLYQAKYFTIGQLVAFWIYAQLTLAGTASTQVIFTLPTSMINTPIGFFSGNCDVSSAGCAGWSDTTHGLIQLHGAANWTLGASRNVNVGGFYIKP